jgi:exodeoxyribonuclease III
MSTKLISWNVNGIRAIIQKGFMDFFNKEDFDILCLQEIKVHNGDIPDNIKNIGALKGFKNYWNGAERKGYSGTAIITKKIPLSYSSQLGDSRFDSEGRIQIMEFENFYLINTYVPNVKHDLSRLNERQEFDDLMRSKVKELENKKPVVLCGDMNVAHKEIDLARPKENVGNAGFTNEEREGMTKYVDAGLVDSFRFFYPDKEDEYSWWSYRGGARYRNVGWRIDYFLTSKNLRLKGAGIMQKVIGSDHCPVWLELIF